MIETKFKSHLIESTHVVRRMIEGKQHIVNLEKQIMSMDFKR